MPDIKLYTTQEGHNWRCYGVMNGENKAFTGISEYMVKGLAENHAQRLGLPLDIIKFYNIEAPEALIDKDSGLNA